MEICARSGPSSIMANHALILKNSVVAGAFIDRLFPFYFTLFNGGKHPRPSAVSLSI